jgi:hypothetical protein
LTAVLGVTIAALGVALFAFSELQPRSVSVLPWIGSPVARSTAPVPVPISRPTRPVYRHSVIPGGALNQRELREAVRLDAVVAEHYRDFDVTRAHLVRIEAPLAMHVSYRLGDKVYWTKEKVWLRPGETLLSDGVNLCRGRCGNRVAAVPLGRTSPVEPAPEVLDETLPPSVGIEPLRGFDLLFPVALVDLPSNPLPVVAEPIVASPLFVSTPEIMPPVGVAEVRVPDPGPSDFPSPIPEPGTLLLVGSAALALTFGAIGRARRRRSDA